MFSKFFKVFYILIRLYPSPHACVRDTRLVHHLLHLPMSSLILQRSDKCCFGPYYFDVRSFTSSSHVQRLLHEQVLTVEDVETTFASLNALMSKVQDEYNIYVQLLFLAMPWLLMVLPIARPTSMEPIIVIFALEATFLLLSRVSGCCRFSCPESYLVHERIHDVFQDWIDRDVLYSVSYQEQEMSRGRGGSRGASRRRSKITFTFSFPPPSRRHRTISPDRVFLNLVVSSSDDEDDGASTSTMATLDQNSVEDVTQTPINVVPFYQVSWELAPKQLVLSCALHPPFIVEKEKLTAECVICMDVITRPTITPCRHIFCHDCITQQINHRPKCPMCRRPISNDSLTEIALDVDTVEENDGMKK